MIDAVRAKEIVEMPETADLLRKYKFVTLTLFNTDASDDYTFQKAYCELYKLNTGYSEEFRTKFFFVLEEMKKKSDIEFRNALEKLQAIEGKIEMTAASVLVHTVNPRFPIWYKRTVEDFFDMEVPRKKASFERCCKLYDDFFAEFYNYSNSPEGDALVRAFDEKFPNADIPDVIKVGFIIWENN